MISRGSDVKDFVWGLDHSWRRYLVRPARHADLLYFKTKDPKDLIVIVRLHDCVEMAVLPAQCDFVPGPWVNTDAYAELRLSSLVRGCTRRDRRNDR